MFSPTGMLRRSFMLTMISIFSAPPYSSSLLLSVSTLRSSGGRTVYSGAGSAVAKEAKSDANMKSGGKVPGKKGRGRFAKGGCVSSPMSSAGGGSATKHPFAR